VDVNIAVTVTRDDGTVLTRTESYGNGGRWVLNRPRRLTRTEVRKGIDARVAAALNSMGVR
jgi:hypothetical protein